MKATDQQLINSYEVNRSVWRVAREFGMCGQSVHQRLTRLGEINTMRAFTELESSILKRDYVRCRDEGRLQALADHLQRTKPFICRKAKDMGLTDPKHHKPYALKPGADPYMKNHARVRSMRGKPQKCERCGCEDPGVVYEWANLTGRYDDPSDYKRMCRKCHRAYDATR